MNANFLDKIGSVGAIMAGAAVPCCFPFLGLFGSMLGLSFLAGYGSTVVYVLQGSVLVALVGSLIAYLGHRKAAPLVLAVLSTASVIYGVNTGDLNVYYVYGGMAGLLAVAVWNSIESRRCSSLCQLP
jgi:hypothetical protein